MPWEKEVLLKYPDNMYIQLTIGSARLVRMNKVEHNQDKYNFGASFAAPILYNYINYILEQSLKNGFKTLHFIARDGYLPKVIADTIIRKRNLDIKTVYLYGSRHAWRIPTADNLERYIKESIR
jgi:predicted HAD superfamily hydrolase